MWLRKSGLVLWAAMMVSGAMGQTLPRLVREGGSAGSFAESQWWPAVSGAYALGAGQVVVQVLRPTTEAMAAYLKEKEIQSGGVLLFQSRGGQLMGFTQNFGGWENQTSLDDLIRIGAGLTNAEFRVADELREVRLPGDWTFDVAARADDVLRGIGEAAAAAGHPLAIRREEESRTVLVVSGTPNIQHGPGKRNVHVYLGEAEGENIANTYSDRVEDFLRLLANYLRVPVIPESAEFHRLAGQDFGAKYMKSAAMELGEAETAEGRAMLEEILKNLRAQTGLEFRLEKRACTFWDISPAPR